MSKGLRTACWTKKKCINGNPASRTFTIHFIHFYLPLLLSLLTSLRKKIPFLVATNSSMARFVGDGHFHWIQFALPHLLILTCLAFYFHFSKKYSDLLRFFHKLLNESYYLDPSKWWVCIDMTILVDLDHSQQQLILDLHCHIIFTTNIDYALNSSKSDL